VLTGCPTYSPGVYSRDVFPCWASRCNGADAPAACFEGKKLCQHSETECAGDTIEACAQSAYPAPNLYAPFVYCLEGEGGFYNQSAGVGGVNGSAVGACAAQAGIEPAPIIACVASEAMTKALDAADARATAQMAASVPAAEWGTPYVLVDGVNLADTTRLRATVCDAWASQGGRPPYGCAYNWLTWQEGATLGAGVGGGLLASALLVCLCYCCCCRKGRVPDERSRSLMEESEAQAARRAFD